MKSNELNVPTKYWLIAGLIAFLLLSGSLGSLWQNKGLKNDIRVRDARIDSLDKAKEPILKEIKEIEDEVKRQESVILALSKIAETLKENIKKVKDENRRISDIYIHSSIDERVRLFAELATKQDKAQ